MVGSPQHTRQKPEGAPAPVEPSQSRSLGEALVDRLMAPISIAPLVYFRVAFGGILLWSVGMFFNYKGVD
ncbi:MAG: hypothetical protein AB7O26_19670, partial [Planctomycetaceae bacterium]